MPYKKGQSGNPGGRPAIPKDLLQAFRKLTPKALKVVEAALDSSDEKIAMEAAKHVFDRALGKPAQTVVDGTAAEDRTITVILPGLDKAAE